MKNKLNKKDIEEIILNYDLGELESFKYFTTGTVQQNIFVKTSKGKYVFRLYVKGRPKQSVLFEVNLINYLKQNSFPCPGVIKNKEGKFLGIYDSKPFVIFEFIEGEHLENPNEKQKKELIKKVADFHNITKDYKASLKKFRFNYSPELCRKLASKEAKKIGTKNAHDKLDWIKDKSRELILPNNLQKGICHCDFDYSNIIFKNNKFEALIDFDDANYTYLIFDLVHLIEGGAWHHTNDSLNFAKAKKVIKEYQKYRILNNIEKKHLFDVYKLSILFDSIWFMKRGGAGDFYEKRKIDYLDNVGRENFYQRLF